MFEDGVKRRKAVAYRESPCGRSRLVSVASEGSNKEKKKEVVGTRGSLGTRKTFY